MAYCIVRLGLALILLAATAAAQSPPLANARPAKVTHRYPIVMFSGGGQSGLNYTGTPDGREGWMQYFVRQGYAVYVLDQPSRARSGHQPEVGPQSRNGVERIQQRFTAPERSHLWPQARLHTQWPGSGVAGDLALGHVL